MKEKTKEEIIAEIDKQIKGQKELPWARTSVYTQGMIYGLETARSILTGEYFEPEKG